MSDLEFNEDIDDFCLPRLFTASNYDHISLNEQANQYKHSNMLRTLYYVKAAKCFGRGIERKRVHNVYGGGIGSKHVDRNPSLDIKFQEKDNITKDKYEEFKKWLEKRKSFRSDIDNPHMVEEWLSRKQNKNDLEKSVLLKIKKKRYPTPPPKTPTPEPVEETNTDPPSDLRLPAPIAVETLSRHAKDSGLRLTDLFVAIDKTKSGRIGVAELRAYLDKNGVQISDIHLEDLIVALDSDFDESIDYRDLATGVEQLRQETTGDIHARRRKANRSMLRGDSVMLNRLPASERLHLLVENRLAVSDPIYPPGPDDRLDEDASDEAMLELRRWNRAIAARKLGRRLRYRPPVVGSDSASVKANSARSASEAEVPHRPMSRTGAHMQASSLGESTAKFVDQFRSEKLQTYEAVAARAASTKAVQRGLLHPADLSPDEMAKRLSAVGIAARVADLALEAEEAARVRREATLRNRVGGDFDPHADPSVESYEKRHARRTQPFTWKRHNAKDRRVDCWMTSDQFLTASSDFSFLAGAPSRSADRGSFLFPVGSLPSESSVFQRTVKQSTAGQLSAEPKLSVAENGYLNYPRPAPRRH